VKEMVKGYLERNYSKPDISDLKVIGIDEFAVKKGHVYKTIVVNLETGQIVYVGDGKGADALDGFWRMVKKAGVKIEAVASDLSAAYISAVRENAPDAVYVFDHFHLVKLINEALDKVRRRIVNQERAKEKKEGVDGKSSVVKGTKYILLRNSEDITEKKDIDRLHAALELNRDLSAAYYLKEDARLIWDCDSKRQASLQLDAWISSARTSLVPELVKVADTVDSHRDGILAYLDKPISTGPVEGINNKIKTLKRMAYGFRDDRYFTLRLLALHDFKFS
jgi:transposase